LLYAMGKTAELHAAVCLACVACAVAFSPTAALRASRLTSWTGGGAPSAVSAPLLGSASFVNMPRRNAGMGGFAARRGAPVGLRMMGDSADDLSKKFEEEKRTRLEMDKIFSDASADLQQLANKEMETLKAETEDLLQQREEEWEALGNKAAASMVSKVDSLAEDFLKKAGRSVDDDDDDFGELERFLGPEVVAVIGEKSELRDEVMRGVEGQASLSVSSCERLLETRGLKIENTDTLIFVGDGDPLDRYTVERLIGRCLKLRRVLVVSSLGTERANLFPFSLQNALTGALDKKRGVELGVIELSKKMGFAFSVLRVGKVKAKGGGLGGVQMAAGDKMSEEIQADVAADAILQALMLQPAALNCSMSLVGTKAASVSQDGWDDEFLRLEGPEVWRETLSGGVSVEACRDFIQQGWSARWTKSGTGLTTPVRVEQTKDGVRLVFVPPQSTFVSFKEEKAMEKARDKGEEYEDGFKAKSSSKDMEGGVEVIVEASPTPRVRARRCNMAEDIPVKETSEQVILGSLMKEIKAWEGKNGK